MDTLIPKGTLLTIPREIIEMIIQLLENQDLASILMTCKYLNDVCEHPKFWKKLEFNAMKIVSATSMCEKIVKKYSVKGVNEFRKAKNEWEQDINDVMSQEPLEDHDFSESEKSAKKESEESVHQEGEKQTAS